MKNIGSKCKLAVALLIPFLVLGCASTSMTSEANPEFAGHHFTTLLVEGGFSDLGQRQYAEDQLCEYLADYSDVQCIESLKIFFPGEKYTWAQISSRLSELHIDGVLMLKPTNSGVVSAYIPPTTYTTGSASVYGDTVYASSTTQTFGGYNFLKPWASFQAILYSTSNDKIAWYATADSKGNAFAKWDDLIESAAERTAKKLVNDEVVQPVQNKN